MKHKLFSLFLYFLPIAVQAETFEITLKDSEKTTIHEIVTAFKEKDDQVFIQNAGALMPKVMTLMETSPFQIIGYILSEEDLKETFIVASKSPLKWNLFIQAFNIKMEQEMMKGNVTKYLESFSEYLSLDVQEMENLAQHHAWGELAMYALRGQE